jgi:hypothetical protein
MKRRKELFGMFYLLERTAEKLWANLFKSGFNNIVSKFPELVSEKEYEHEK